MSDKRFERWNDHSCKVKDNQEDTLLNWEDVVHKLNEQQSIIHKDEISIKTMMSNMEKVEKENEQLRQFINKGRRLSVKELMANTNENELLKKEIKELEKENKELQKDKAQLKERLRECRIKMDKFNCR